MKLGLPNLKPPHSFIQLLFRHSLREQHCRLSPVPKIPGLFNPSECQHTRFVHVNFINYMILFPGMTVSLSFHGRQRGTQLSRFSSLLACVQPCGILWEIVMKPTTTGNRLVTLHTCRTVALLSYKVGIWDHPSFLGPESDSFAAVILY